MGCTVNGALLLLCRLGVFFLFSEHARALLVIRVYFIARPSPARAPPPYPSLSHRYVPLALTQSPGRLGKMACVSVRACTHARAFIAGFSAPSYVSFLRMVVHLFLYMYIEAFSSPRQSVQPYKPDSAAAAALPSSPSVSLSRPMHFA